MKQVSNLDKRLILKFGNFDFIVPNQVEDLYPYYRVLYAGEYEELLDQIDEHYIVLDAGAHIGFFPLPASVKARLVIAVEPSPESFRLLVSNIKLNRIKNIIQVNEALSDYVGHAYIIGKGALKSLSTDGGTKVRLKTLDDLLKGLGIRRINILKLDIEGSELRALRDFSGLKAVRELVVDVHGKENMDAVSRILRVNGFEVTKWSFSCVHTLLRAAYHLTDLVRAEIATRFIAMRLAFKSLLRARHLVPPATGKSGTKILYT